MTTAARPTFNPAVGGEDQGYFRMDGGTRQISVKDMPGHTRLKMRRQGQGSQQEMQQHDMRAALREREEKAMGGSSSKSTRSEAGESSKKVAMLQNAQDADDFVASDNDSDDSDDDDDETAELMRELERIKKEREEEAAKKAAEDKLREEHERKEAMLRGNPLLGGAGAGSFGVKRRWDDDVVFRNQARTEPEQKKRFINDTVRNDFHKRFLNKYVK